MVAHQLWELAVGGSNPPSPTRSSRGDADSRAGDRAVACAVPSVSAPDGATIPYEATGAGPVVVLVHGITESHHSWDSLIGELALDFQVVAVDLRGHGASERRAPYDALTMAVDLHAVVEAVGAPSPLMIGHSLGGAVVSIYARRTRRVVSSTSISR